MISWQLKSLTLLLAVCFTVIFAQSANRASCFGKDKNRFPRVWAGQNLDESIISTVVSDDNDALFLGGMMHLHDVSICSTCSNEYSMTLERIDITRGNRVWFRVYYKEGATYDFTVAALAPLASDKS